MGFVLHLPVHSLVFGVATRARGVPAIYLAGAMHFLSAWAASARKWRQPRVEDDRESACLVVLVPEERGP